jgi:O-antigen/teichoic acid export membrane protein
MAQGATFLTNILVANLLGLEVFGQYSIILSTLLTVVGITQLATGLTATRYVAELRFRDKPRAGRILGLCSTVALVAGVGATAALSISSSWLASVVLNVPQAAQGLLIASAFVLFSVMNAYQTGALAGLESFQTLARLGAVSAVVQLAATVGLAGLWGLDGALVGFVLAAALRWWLHARAIRSEAETIGIRVIRRGLGKERSVLFRFALPAAISGISTLPALWLANAFLVRQPNGLSEMALFAAANNLRILVLFLPNLLNGVGTSLINNQLSAGDRNEYSKVFWMNVSLTSAATIAAAAVIAFTGPAVLRLYGQDFVSGYPVLLVLLGATVLEGVALGPYQVIQSRERMWLSLFVIAIPRDLSLAVLAYFLTPQHGAVGLAYAYVLAWLLAATAIAFSSYRIGRQRVWAEVGREGVLK